MEGKTISLKLAGVKKAGGKQKKKKQNKKTKDNADEKLEDEEADEDPMITFKLPDAEIPRNAFAYVQLLDKVIASIDEHRAKLGLGPNFKPLQRRGLPVITSSRSKTLEGVSAKLDKQTKNGPQAKNYDMDVYLLLMGGTTWKTSSSGKRYKFT
ncbi:hypothetical protein QFC22_001772 [Naganishia vaughanmartiniae]|uniref:Uncharacterized protein n=1 Tax=Naganishia vaughanmartiniae TaxID=1424756 RepID=A0ACC2XE74_9TREE|nr:hypothetical protein QFC22_001772 [Naganishia vaughanmartiniae]